MASVSEVKDVSTVDKQNSKNGSLPELMDHSQNYAFFSHLLGVHRSISFALLHLKNQPRQHEMHATSRFKPLSFHEMLM